MLKTTTIFDAKNNHSHFSCLFRCTPVEEAASHNKLTGRRAVQIGTGETIPGPGNARTGNEAGMDVEQANNRQRTWIKRGSTTIDVSDDIIFERLNDAVADAENTLQEGIELINNLNEMDNY